MIKQGDSSPRESEAIDRSAAVIEDKPRRLVQPSYLPRLSRGISGGDENDLSGRSVEWFFCVQPAIIAQPQVLEYLEFLTLGHIYRSDLLWASA